MKKTACSMLLASSLLVPFGQSAFANIPLLTIDSGGGGAIVPWAYISNAPKKGGIGMPAASIWTWVSDSYTINFWPVAVSIGDRLELGFAYQNLDISTLRSDLRNDSAAVAVLAANRLDTKLDNLQMITAHAKFQFLKETETLPAMAISVSYKKALDIDELDDNLTANVRAVLGSGAPKVMEWMGVDDDSGFEVNLMATKLWKTKIPILTAVNLRYTQANQLGFLGFSDDWSLNPEFTLAILPEPNVAIGIEYRKKPDELRSVHDYLNANAGGAGVSNGALNDYTFGEDDFIDFFVAYLPTPNLTIAAGIANIGNVVHRETKSIWAFNINYDF
ncbi:MAG: DUF3034 family protein [Candidatus Polarisedimenticolaceae bacterium]|nr:DUF3034 family protein [Candidatus Polarisedimenticolaceae bacterium]